MLIRAFLSPPSNPPHPYRPALQENTHRLTLSMSPDEAYMEKQAKAEEEKLQKKVQALSDSDRKEIYEKGTHNFTLHCGESLFSFARVSLLPALALSEFQTQI